MANARVVVNRRVFSRGTLAQWPYIRFKYGLMEMANKSLAHSGRDASSLDCLQLRCIRLRIELALRRNGQCDVRGPL